MSFLSRASLCICLLYNKLSAGVQLRLRVRGRNYMVAADRLHATLDLSLPIHLRGRHPLVELAPFHQKLIRRHLTHFCYLHRVLNHHRTNTYIRSVPSYAGKPRGNPRVARFAYFFLSKAREYQLKLLGCYANFCRFLQSFNYRWKIVIGVKYIYIKKNWLFKSN